MDDQRSEPTSLQEMLEAARAKIQRLDPEEARRAIEAGAVVIDVRMHTDRRRDGIVPGSIHIPRTLLEWRVSPDSEWRNPHLGDSDRQVIVMCNHGFSSVLAAASLADLGCTHSSDLIGGFEAWRQVGLPTIAAPEPPASGELEGMDPPEF